MIAAKRGRDASTKKLIGRGKAIAGWWVVMKTIGPFDFVQKRSCNLSSGRRTSRRRMKGCGKEEEETAEKGEKRSVMMMFRLMAKRSR